VANRAAIVRAVASFMVTSMRAAPDVSEPRREIPRTYANQYVCR
jgi:hypothetical protein